MHTSPSLCLPSNGFLILRFSRNNSYIILYRNNSFWLNNVILELVTAKKCNLLSICPERCSSIEFVSFLHRRVSSAQSTNSCCSSSGRTVPQQKTPISMSDSVLGLTRYAHKHCSPKTFVPSDYRCFLQRVFFFTSIAI